MILNEISILNESGTQLMISKQEMPLYSHEPPIMSDFGLCFESIALSANRIEPQKAHRDGVKVR